MTKRPSTECGAPNGLGPFSRTAFEKLPEHIRRPDPGIYMSDNYSVVDYETDVEEFGSPHVEENQAILASVLNGPKHPRPGLTRHHGNALEIGIMIEQDVTAADFVVAHNAKFELGWFDRGGINIGNILPFCTQMAEMCRAGNRRFDLTLAGTLARYGLDGKDPIGALIKMGVDTRNIPVAWLGEYCDIDVVRTEQLMLLQRHMLNERKLFKVFFTRNILTPVLYDVETPGLCLDKDRCTAVYNFYLDKEAKLLAEWAKLTDGVNHNSRPQLRTLLFGKPGVSAVADAPPSTEGPGLGIAPPRDSMGKEMKTEGKQISTSEDALKRLKPRNKKQRAVLAILNELTSANQLATVRKLKECADNEGILHADFTQFSAGTHRLASKGRGYKLQKQNHPREFRPAVRPRNKGWFIGDGDAAGIEFRAAVDLAKDEQGLEDIQSKVDVHANTARITLASRWDESLGDKDGANSAVRQDAKADTFKPLYGGQTGTPVQRDYFAWFRARYAGVSEMQRGWTEQVLNTKQLCTATGLIFYWPGCKLSSDGKYIRYTTQIYDYPVQNFATAEMCPTATVYLWHLMRVAGMRSFLINLVHDSAVGEIHPDEREEWSRLMEFCFNELIVWYLKEVYDYDWTTPLESEVKICRHWTDTDPKGWDGKWEI